MHLTYGYILKENDDALMPAKRCNEIMRLFILPGAAVVNHLPFRAVPLSPSVIILILRPYLVRHLPSWVPWFKYEPVASECKGLGQRIKNEPIEFVRNSMVCTG
jgi:hypothetical protein